MLIFDRIRQFLIECTKFTSSFSFWVHLSTDILLINFVIINFVRFDQNSKNSKIFFARISLLYFRVNISMKEKGLSKQDFSSNTIYNLDKELYQEQILDTECH